MLLLLGLFGMLFIAFLLAWLPLEALLGLVVLGLACLIIARPFFGLLVAAMGVPFGAMIPLPLGAGALTLTPLAIALAFAGWVLAALQRRSLPALRLPRPFLAVLLFFAASQAWAAYWAPDWLAAAFETARWAEMALAMLMAAGLAGRPRAVRGLVAMLLVAGLLQALLGLGMALSFIGPPSFAVLGGRLFRAHGSFGQPNPFAGYMNMVWPLGAAILMTSLSSAKAQRSQLGGPLIGLALLSTAACTLALIASWSRGGWLAAAAGGSLMGLAWLLSGLRERSGQGRMLFILWLALTFMLVILIGGALERVPASIVGRLASIGRTPTVWNVADAEVNDDSFSTIERVAHWEAAVSMWEERTWSGQGPGHYAIAYPMHRLPRWSDALGHAHNTYLNFLAESGILGLLGFLAFLASGFALASRAVFRSSIGPSDDSADDSINDSDTDSNGSPNGRPNGSPSGSPNGRPSGSPSGRRIPTHDPLQRAIGLGLLGVLGALSSHSFLDNLFVHEMTVHLGLLLGLCLAARSAPPRASALSR